MAREERAPRPGQNTAIGEAHYAMRGIIGQYYTATDDEERAITKQILVKRARALVALAEAL